MALAIHLLNWLNLYCTFFEKQALWREANLNFLDLMTVNGRRPSKEWSYKPMFTDSSPWPRIVLWVVRTYNTVLVASGEYTTHVGSLPQHSRGEYLLTSFYRERSRGSDEQRNCHSWVFISSPIPWVSCYILWSAVVTIICYPGRNNKIQRHDNGLIKSWWGATASSILKKCCSQERRSAVPSPVPPLVLFDCY